MPVSRDGDGYNRFMEFHDQLQQDLLAALKARDDSRKWVIKMLKSAIELAEVTKGDRLDHAEFLGLVQKEIKIRREAIEDATRANRPDLISAGEHEIELLEHYLPGQMSEEELIGLARQVITEAGAASPKDIGRVLKILLPRLEGRASNQDASRVVRDCLSSMG